MSAPVDDGTLRSIAIADELTEAYQADTALVELIKKVRAEKPPNMAGSSAEARSHVCGLN